MRLDVNVVRLTRPFTGVGRYLLSLLREWSGMTLPFDEVVLHAPVALHPSAAAFPEERHRLEVRGPRGPDPLWEWWTLGPRSRAGGVLFSPYTLPLGYRGRAVVTYFGPATNLPFTLEGWRARAYDRLYRASARRAACVLTAAGRVKQRIVEAYGVPEARVEVIPLAPDPSFTPVADAERLGRVRRSCGVGDGTYVLFVGKLSGRHCIPQLIEAFGRVRQGASGPLRLLLVGPNVLGLDVAAAARASGVADAVVHRAQVSEEDLPALYSGAEAFVFPATEAEGFGLPLVEAMACGTPVLSTARGSVPEVTGEAALLAPSNEVGALAGVLEGILRDQGLRAELRRRGLERARSFSWRTTAERTMEVLGRVARVPPVGA